MSDDMLRDAYQRHVGDARPRDRTECPSPEALQRLADVALTRASRPNEDRAAMLDHVLGCASCSADFALLRSVAKATHPTASASTRRDSWAPTRIAVAATVLVALGIGGSAWQRSRTRPSEPSFDPSRVLRDEGSTVTLVSPTGVTSARGVASLAWRRVDGADGYVLDVFDTTGAVILSRVSADTSVALDSNEARRLAARGAFDWMVTARRADGNERRSVVTRVRVAP